MTGVRWLKAKIVVEAEFLIFSLIHGPKQFIIEAKPSKEAVTPKGISFDMSFFAVVSSEKIFKV